MKLLVTGAAGFIGSTYVRLVGDEHEVTCSTSSPTPGAARTCPRASSSIVGAIEDPAIVREAMEGADAVVNFAAESHVDRSIDDQDAFARTHVIGTGTLLDAARELGVGRYLQVSTDEVYGSIESGSFTETSPLDPSSPYSATKAAGDLLVSAHVHTYGIEASICRGSNNYGPRQYPEKLIPLMVLNALHGDSLPVYGDGRQVRNWLYVEDFCRGIHTVLMNGRPGEAYNVGGPDECENIEVVKRVIELTGADESLIEYVTDRPGHDRRYSLSSEKLQRGARLGGPGPLRPRASSGPSTGTATTRSGGGRSAPASTASTTRSSTAGRSADVRSGRRASTSPRRSPAGSSGALGPPPPAARRHAPRRAASRSSATATSSRSATSSPASSRSSAACARRTASSTWAAGSAAWRCR